MATIMDVARLAAVSKSTVSRVLNENPRVDVETRKKVFKAIKELKYQPNSFARNFRNGETKLIAVLIPNISNAFFGELVRGMEDAAVNNGYNIILCNTAEDNDREIQYIGMLEQKQVDGVILTALRNPLKMIKPYLKYGPIVLASEYLDDDFLPAVCIDNIAAAQKATEHLIKSGHERIAFINGPENIILCRDRETGYVNAINNSGLSVFDYLIQHSDFTIEGGYNSAESLLKLTDRPTAIFAANDEMAVGAVKALQKYGLNVPKDMSVIGFDNVPVSTVVEPNLTTINQPIYEIGFEAANLLITCLKSGIDSIEHRRITLETKLCIRKSSQV
jgi:LacI family repressor for deo operon, udp, cdd, tsx, nupC, and nupG